MTEKLSAALKTLRDVLHEESHDHCVRVDVEINAEGCSISYSTRTPGSLKRDCISMRNIRGEFIKCS